MGAGGCLEPCNRARGRGVPARMRGLRRTLTVAAAVALVAVAGCAAPGQPEPGETGSSAVSSTSARPVASSAMASAPADMSTPTSAPSPSAPSVIPVDETGAVPWVDTPGTMFFGSPLPVAALPTGGRACRAADLRASGDIGASGGGGHTVAAFEFTDVSATPCILKGFPRVVATEPAKPPVVAVNGGFFVGQETSATMSPGSHTTLSLETERDCDARYASGKNWSTLIYTQRRDDSGRRHCRGARQLRRRMWAVHWSIRRRATRAAVHAVAHRRSHRGDRTAKCGRRRRHP